MMLSRGMGAISKSKLRNVEKTRYARGGEVLPAALIDGDQFVMAAEKYGLNSFDTRILNKIVNLVNQGESVDAAAKKVAGKQ